MKLPVFGKSRKSPKSRDRPNSGRKVKAALSDGFGQKVVPGASQAVLAKFGKSNPEVKAGRGFPGRNSGKSNPTEPGPNRRPDRKVEVGLELELFEKVGLRGPWAGDWKSQGNDLAGGLETIRGVVRRRGRHTMTYRHTGPVQGLVRHTGIRTYYQL